MSHSLANLLIFIMLEIILMMTGMALIPIIVESNYKRYIRIDYILPFFVFLGLLVLGGYYILG